MQEWNIRRSINEFATGVYSCKQILSYVAACVCVLVRVFMCAKI